MCPPEAGQPPFGVGDTWDYHFNGMHFGKLSGAEVSVIYGDQPMVNTSCEIYFELEDSRNRYSFNFYANGIRRSDPRYQEVVAVCLKSKAAH